MPYITPEAREDFEQSISILVRQLKLSQLNVYNRPGAVNYVITRIVTGALKPAGGWSYHSLSRAIAVLRDAASEMDRRLMAPYEDQKISANGDVPEYEYP